MTSYQLNSKNEVGMQSKKSISTANQLSSDIAGRNTGVKSDNKVFNIAILISLLIHLAVLISFTNNKSSPEKVQFTELKIKLGKHNIDIAEAVIKSNQLQSKKYSAPQQSNSTPQNSPLKKDEQPQSAHYKIKEKNTESTKIVSDNKSEIASPKKPEKQSIKKYYKEVIEQTSNEITTYQPEQIASLPTYDNELAGLLFGNSDDGEKIDKYQQLLSGWLNSYRSYPEEAKKKQLEGKGIVFIKIDRDGNVLLSKVIKSTGHEILDDALMEMVSKASPVPPLPLNYYPAQKTLSYEIEFGFVNRNND